MKHTKTQLRINKLSKALGLARMKLKYFTKRNFEGEFLTTFESGRKQGKDEIRVMPFMAKIKYLFF